MTPAHAYLPPSGAASWVACAAWPALQARYPDVEDSQPAREGTAAHWAGAEMIGGSLVALGQIAPNGVVLDQEMIDSAEVWADAVHRVLAASTTRAVVGRTFGAETRLPPSFNDQNWGTPDTWHYDQNAGVLWVIDFKHGHGIVEAEDNWQLVNYAELLRAHLKLPNTTRYKLMVVQPRAFHRDGVARVWAPTGLQMQEAVHRLEMAAEDALSPNPVSRPGPQCTNCSGRHACDALQRDGYRSADLSGVSLPIDLDAEAAGTELLMLRAAQEKLAARVDGLEQQLVRQISRGERSTRWLVESTPGRQTWTVGLEGVRAIGLAAGVTTVKETPVTPKQAADAGVPPELLEGFTERKRTAKLVPFAASRTAKQFGD